MKKDTIRWIAGLAIVLVLYILAAFLIPFVKTATFWASFVFTLVAFGVVGASVYIAFVKNPDAKSRFYGFPVARIGVIYGIVQLIAGLVFMALGQWVPVWAAVLVYAAALGTAAIGLISAEAVAEQIQVQDTKLKKDVALMRALQSRLCQMPAQCRDPEAAAAVKALSEELRYSDPVSSEAMARIEWDLAAAVDELQRAVAQGDGEAVKQLCAKAAAILSERNRLCRLTKG